MIDGGELMIDNKELKTPELAEGDTDSPGNTQSEFPYQPGGSEQVRIIIPNGPEVYLSSSLVDVRELISYAFGALKELSYKNNDNKKEQKYVG